MKLKALLVCIFSFYLILHVKAESELDTVTINLGWQNQFEFAGFYAAKELGFYREQGIEVNFFSPQDNQYYVFPKNDEFSYFVASAGRVLGAQNNDEFLIVSTLFQQSPITLIVRNSDNINSLKEMEGKRVGSGPEIKAMLKMAGANLDSIQFSGPTTNTQYLLDNQLDGLTLFINDAYIRDVIEQNFKIFRPLEYGINFYGQCLVSTQRELEENPDRVKKIRDATIKGWQYAIKNPEKVAQIIKEKYNLEIELTDLEKESEIIINSLILPKLYVFATSDEARWENMSNILTDLKILKKSPDLNKLLYRPENDRDERLQHFLQVSLIVLVVIGLFLLLVIVYNFQLKKAINKKTLELRVANTELETLNLFRVKILAIISHDTKGPIHNLKALIQLFNSGKLQPDNLKKLLKEIENKLDGVNMFLDNILKWSKQNFDKKEELVKSKIINLIPVIDKIVSLFSFDIEKKNITIKKDILVQSVFADENMLDTILRNLIANAIKFTEEGGDISIKAREQVGMIRIIIEDNGMGMSKEQLQDIFTENVISTKGSKQEIGTGLGLLLCKQYVELNQGKIGVESKEGIGSTFWFELPVEPNITTV